MTKRSCFRTAGVSSWSLITSSGEWCMGRKGRSYWQLGSKLTSPSRASQTRVTLTSFVRHSQELVLRLSALHFGHREFVCLEFLVLFSLDVKNLKNFQLVESVGTGECCPAGLNGLKLPTANGEIQTATSSSTTGNSGSQHAGRRIPLLQASEWRCTLQ